LPTRGPLGTIDARDTAVRGALKCCALEVLSVGDVLACFRQPFKERLRALIRRA
jgi:hypothetical protein